MDLYHSFGEQSFASFIPTYFNCLSTYKYLCTYLQYDFKIVVGFIASVSKL